MIIEGQLVSTRRSPRKQIMMKANLYPTQFQELVIYRPRPGYSVLLHKAQIVTRPSGRKNRHLAIYLIGLDAAGLVIEIFLGLAKKTRNWLFGLRLKIQTRLVTFFAGGLGVSQAIGAVIGG